jgi:hypothetical protein
VRDAEPRAPGFLRVHLAPVAEGATVIVPLPLRWTAQGAITGLGVLAYPLAEPQAMTILPPRRIEIR